MQATALPLSLRISGNSVVKNEFTTEHTEEHRDQRQQLSRTVRKPPHKMVRVPTEAGDSLDSVRLRELCGSEPVH